MVFKEKSMSQNFDDSEEELSFSHIIDTALHHIWLISGIFVVALALGIAYAFLATPTYVADALVQVEDKKNTTLSGLQDIASALGTGSIPVSGEIEILRSREVIMKAIEATRADIAVYPKYFPVIGNWLVRRYDSEGIAEAPIGLNSYVWGGEKIRITEFAVPDELQDKPFVLISRGQGKFVLENEDGEELATGVPRQRVSFSVRGKDASIYVSELLANEGATFRVAKVDPINAYRSILRRLTIVESGRQSGIIRVSYVDSDVDFAQRFVNAIADAYLTQNVERRSAEADHSLKFLDEQLPEIKRSVERAEDALNAFRTRTNTIDVDKSTESLLKQAVDVEKERLELQLKRDQLRQRYKPDHPELKAVEAQLAATVKESEKIGGIVNSLPGAQRDLLRLQRDAEVNNQLYIALLNNAQQLKVAKAGTIGNVRIVDYAVKDPQPVAPKKAAIVLIAGVLGLLLGGGAAFISRILRPTVRDVSEIERSTGLVSYASVPESGTQEKLDSSKRDRKGRAAIVDGRNQLLAVLEPNDPAIESLRSLRTGLTFAMMGAENKNIVITGPTAALGKSFISANLSVLLAATKKKVLLVETDLRRPQLGSYFGYNKVLGLSEVLAGSVPLEHVLRKETFLDTEVTVLPSGQTPPNPGELLLSRQFTELVESFQNDYDYIIFDSPPVLPVGDVLAVARHASTVFMVVRSEQSTVPEVKDAIRKLASAGISVKGVVFNGVKRRRVGYSYAYKYYYGYGDK